MPTDRGRNNDDGAYMLFRAVVCYHLRVLYFARNVIRKQGGKYKASPFYDIK